MPNIDKIRIDNVDYDITKGETYSTEETVIGTWIDGKPIYRKVYNITGSNLTQDVTDLHIDTLVKLDGFINDGMPLNLYMDNSHFCFTHCNSLTEISCSMTGWTATKVKYIIEYTKTTDTVN